jgi:hypothetical protein
MDDPEGAAALIASVRDITHIEFNARRPNDTEDDDNQRARNQPGGQAESKIGSEPRPSRDESRAADDDGAGDKPHEEVCDAYHVGSSVSHAARCTARHGVGSHAAPPISGKSGRARPKHPVHPEGLLSARATASAPRAQREVVVGDGASDDHAGRDRLAAPGRRDSRSGSNLADRSPSCDGSLTAGITFP